MEKRIYYLQKKHLKEYKLFIRKNPILSENHGENVSYLEAFLIEKKIIPDERKQTKLKKYL